MSEWISVEDRLPDDGQYVAYRYEYWRYHRMRGIEESEGHYCHTKGGGLFGEIDYDDHYEKVTHWRPAEAPQD